MYYTMGTYVAVLTQPRIYQLGRVTAFSTTPTQGYAKVPAAGGMLRVGGGCPTALAVRSPACTLFGYTIAPVVLIQRSTPLGTHAVIIFGVTLESPTIVIMHRRLGQANVGYRPSSGHDTHSATHRFPGRHTPWPNNPSMLN